MQITTFNSENGTHQSKLSTLSLQRWHSSLSNIWRAFLRSSKFTTLRDVCKSSVSSVHYGTNFQKRPIKAVPGFNFGLNSIAGPILYPESYEPNQESIFSLRDLTRQQIWAAVLATRCDVQSMQENVSLHTLLSSIPLPAPLLQFIAFN